MKNKMKYLILLLSTFLVVGCTNAEVASNTDFGTDNKRKQL